MQYAVIATGGKQYQVSVGSVVNVEKLVAEQEIVFDQVLLVVDDDKIEMGTPTVAGIKVYATKVADVKGDKIEVFKYKSKSRYRKHTGHRQTYTQVKIMAIGEQKAPNTKPVTSKPAGRSVKKATPKKPVTKKAAK